MQIGQNASFLMSSLPVHSHHRQALVRILSRDLSSGIASQYLHVPASTIRAYASKRKDLAESDLLNDKYARDVKRQRLDESVRAEAEQFLTATCPTKSGDTRPTKRQYITDRQLFESYKQSVSNAVSFNTFKKIKQSMHVRHAGKYMGFFDCPICFRMRMLPFELAKTSDFATRLKYSLEAIIYRRHHELHFINTISTN